MSLMLSYLSDRVQYVELSDNSMSNLLSLHAGVPQGSVLGPLIFSMYINDLSSVITNCKFRFFADDIQLFLTVDPHNYDHDISLLNNDLLAVSNWASLNRLNLNCEKSQAICFYKDNLPSSFPSIKINNTVLPLCDNVKNLGVQFEYNLSWDIQIKAICNKAYSTLRSLRHFQKVTPPKTKLFLVKSLVLSNLFYCDILYSEFNVSQYRRINVLFNNCIRYIHNMNRFSHVSHLSSSIYGCSLREYFNLRFLVFLHKLIISKCPSFLFNNFSFSQSNRLLNINLPIFHSNIMTGSLMVRGARLWNNLPFEIKTLSSPNQFKICVKNFFNDS